MDHDAATPSRASAVLHALSSLTPPSPILSPSQLSTVWSSGEIPILFDFSAVLSPSPSLQSGKLVASASVNTVDTIGTFGPTHNIRTVDQESVETRLVHSSNSRQSWSGLLDSSGSAGALDAFDDPGSKLSGSPAPSFSATSLPRHVGYYEQASIPSESLSRFSISAYLQSPLSNLEVASWSPGCTPLSKALLDAPRIGRASHSADDISSSNSIALCEEDDEGQVLQYKTTCQTFSALPTPSFVPPSPSPSVDLVGSWGSRSSNKLHSLEPANRLEPASTQNQEERPCLPTSASWLTVPESVCEPLLQQPMPGLPKSPKRGPALPPKFAWLYGTTVSLFIDQEGFRAIQPSFRLAGYAQGTAEFIPHKRETFVFHHAPLDSAPTLRRVTVNGDETHDHVARQATLSLRANGVYTVCGAEVAAVALAESDRLTWRFAYVVDDRRAGGQGEKTFTPLTFSCAPALLHPLQGKKIRLMHVVRKSVAPKLAAEKLGPPTRPVEADDVEFVTITRQTQHVWNVHRRAQSHAAKGGHDDHRVRGPSTSRAVSGPGQVPPTVQDKPPARRPGRRRASSAGERGQIGERGLGDGSCFAESSAVARHILPRAELCRLFQDEAPEKDEAELRALRPPPLHRSMVRSGGC